MPYVSCKLDNKSDYRALDKPDSDIDNPVPDELEGIIDTSPSVVFIHLPQL